MQPSAARKEDIFLGGGHSEHSPLILTGCLFGVEGSEFTNPIQLFQSLFQSSWIGLLLDPQIDEAVGT